MRKKGILFLTLSLLVLTAGTFKSQAQVMESLGTFTPYSMFGVGDLVRPGTSLNRGMGGIGVGLRDNRFINYLNPASASARDSLSFMLDFGLMQGNYVNQDAARTSAYNALSMNHIIMSFPVWKTSAMQLGLIPYSHVGYRFVEEEKREDILATIGAFRYYQFGQGSINQVFAAYSATFFRHLAVGVQGMYYFGNLQKNTNAVSITSPELYGTLKTGYDIAIGSFGAQVGAQVFGNFTPRTSFTLGATFQPAGALRGEVTRFARVEKSSVIDTVYSVVNKESQMYIPMEWTVGFSVRKQDSWVFGMDYTQSDWKKSNFAYTPGITFEPGISRTFKAGFEIVPDRYSIRYFMRRLTYRVGAYYDRSYMVLNGKQVDAMGITLGFSVPVFRWYNSIGVSVDAGQRGSIEDNLIRERYIMLILNFNLHDIWFLKHRYN
ncbi:MAG: hypothetical protein GX877_00495 [Bacteroidales bacterium]|nr:hypothetical protein [Bacteroidales bacterium]